MSQAKAILSYEEIGVLSHQKNSLTRRVYEELIKRFMSRQLVPGEMINRREIAKEMGVSVAPVLEALVQLEMEGFLESVPRRGTFVSPVKEEDAYAQLLIREGFETSAARIYCGDSVACHYEELLSYATYMDDMADKNQEMTFAYRQAEVVFHTSLVNLCCMPMFTREYIKSVRIGVFTNINRIEKHLTTKQKHTLLLKELVLGDKEKAVSAVKSHLWSGKPLLRNGISDFVNNRSRTEDI